MNNFGKKLRELRIKKGYSTTKASTVTFISSGLYTEYENNIKLPTLPNLQRIIKGFYLSNDEILYLIKDNKKED